MTTPYYEIVTYTVADARNADTARDAARTRLGSFPGFIHWTAFTGAGNADARVDLVAWCSLEEARSAANAVGSSPEFADFRSSVTNLVSMEHYRLPQSAPHPIVSENGVEIGRFRLKPGVSEADMRRAHAAMVERHLAAQAGWRRQHLIKLDDGVFLDLAFADARDHAETICASWSGQADCDAFLALIDPESMEFGAVL
ncbi:hypothetical protein [Pseudaminobacter soli (ex Li et al. 2025)]|uniref:ABM domain-containing protein n=1 Tax=Pseudaminobacter soli (ex Li et al. 2025) TaxID=1295366 RepID=A0A2P7RNE8_9HYPH|nr:hypothetical protein [Mesorhizobium soli]PSJ51726.1 hypothetical protein C7I85_29370 [Mesorhizobium soli]